jgi:phage terminase large subunit-like protein
VPLDWTTACPDWEARIVRGESLIPCPPLFPAEAAAALDVFRQLRIVDAPGSPTMGEAARPWVLDFVAAVFGSYDHSTGRRLIREFFELLSKKNAKSTTAAGIMLTALLRNWRLSGEFLILAPTIEIANNAYGPARDMVRADPELEALLHVQDHLRTITHRGTKATLKVVAADNETVGGKKAIGVLVDELWLFGKRAGAENMLREAMGGLASRPEGFVIYLSTQSDEPPAGVFRQKLLYARGVRDGRIADKRFLPVVYEFPQAMLDSGAHREKANFYVTNPNLGASVDAEFLERELDKAVEAGEASLRGFLAKHLNVEIGLALRSDRWAGADFWESQADPALTLEAILERSDVVTIGIDGGGLDDLLGLAVVGRDAETRDWLHWGHAWAHGSVLERRKSEADRLRDFARQGDLTIVERLGEDIEDLVGRIAAIEATGKLAQVGLDPVGIGAIVDALAEIGIAGDRVVGIPQGWKLAGAIKTAERKLADRTLWHGGRALMAWVVGNAKVEPRGNAIMVTKQAAGTAKIDPLMALYDTIALMSTNPEPAVMPAIIAL